ncbi:MAG: 4Fe-4S binding protein [Geminicoccaceae bacterium]
MPLDGQALARALGSAVDPVVHQQLCRRQLSNIDAAAAAGEPLLIACTQEAALFAEALGELDDAPAVAFVNIREQAGWSEEGGKATPKLAALLATAAIEATVPSVLTLRSEGRCLVLGRGDEALSAARQLAPRLSVTLLLTGADELLPPRAIEFPILRGSITSATGHLGAFAIQVAGLAAASVSSRQRLSFEPVQKSGRLEADLIVDLTGGQPLFPAPAKRDGYLRSDPGDPVAVQRALFDATGMVGEFEKPRYVTYDEAICAHSRSGRIGCTRCLDLCPTGAIVPAGDHVRIDPFVCAGCGACSGVCPTGAATYAAPATDALLERLRVLLGTYLAAGGNDPLLLVHEDRHGGDLIDAMARLGRGLPARVLPFAVSEIAQLGFESFAAAVAFGAAKVVVLAPPRKSEEFVGLEAVLGYVGAVLEGLGYGDDRLALLIEDDPDIVEAALYDWPRAPALSPGAFRPMGGKRALMRQAAEQLHRTAPVPVDVVALPAGAPFGNLQIDAEGCTLCLACVGACPTGALIDNPERPMLRFLEDACVQCGLCQNTCPEKVIRLEPRLDFTAAARSPRTIKEEEPALCIRCGKPFGTRSSIERIVAKLAGRNPLFQTPEQVERIRMCDDCRVVSQFEAKDNPMALGQIRRPKTSEDYLRERTSNSLRKPDNN